ncbi:MAG: hypothetical protein GAK35_03673 [Herbaspirillum frisingense]|uniref:Glycoside-hydrolase family GH114 TIM-barrel domain-containing protein n=1 Tax=Herbaspirillum frisingense TaxID=92645 RepID=A0A7V8FTU9_9BURK|nr:MAG: hypothetical protein GAK35_03673 [Herbaspirillum frisingense]
MFKWSFLSILTVAGTLPCGLHVSIGAAPAVAATSVARWTPRATDTWQWQLRGTLDSSYEVDVYDVDLVDTPQATIDRLHQQNRRVVCYFSAGSWEKFRDDAGAIPAADQGKTLKGWDDERWLDIRSAGVRRFMTERRLDLAVKKRCDGVEPDNVDGYANDTGFPLTAHEQLVYNRFLAAEAHRRNLAVGLKNDLDQVEALAGDFDFAVNEQCHEFEECGKQRPFTAKGKPIFNAEYKPDYRDNRMNARTRLCAAAKAAGIHTLVLPLALDGSFRFSCDTP